MYMKRTSPPPPPGGGPALVSSSIRENVEKLGTTRYVSLVIGSAGSTSNPKQPFI